MLLDFIYIKLFPNFISSENDYKNLINATNYALISSKANLL